MEDGGNRSSRRSVRLLKAAFLRLLAEEPYDLITVSDVTREADLNRGTFYAHFDNIDELLRSTMSDVSEKISLLMDQSIDVDFLDDPMPVLGQIGECLSKDRDLYRKLVSSTSVEPFINSLHETFCRSIRERMARTGACGDARLSAILTEYLTSGVLGTYRSWLAGDYGDATVDEVNAYLCSLVRSTGRMASASGASGGVVAPTRGKVAGAQAR